MYFAIQMVQLPVLLRKTNSLVLSSSDLLYCTSLTSLCFPESFPSAQRIILHLYKMIIEFHIPVAHTPSYAVLSCKTNSPINPCISAYVLSGVYSNYASNSITPLNSVLFEATGLPSGCGVLCPPFTQFLSCTRSIDSHCALDSPSWDPTLDSTASSTLWSRSHLPDL